MRAKRFFAGLLSAVLLITSLPVQAAAAETGSSPILPDVFQGDGLYLTVTPWELEGDWDVWVGQTEFHDGYIKVSRYESIRDEFGYTNSKYKEEIYNLVDKNGNIMLDYSGIMPTKLYYNDGMCLFYDKLTELWGYMDMTGNIVIEPQFRDAYPFSDGLAAVQYGDYYTGYARYYIDKSGNRVLGPYDEYADLGYFGDGLAPVSIADFFGEGKRFNGYINKQGEAVIDLGVGRYEDVLQLIDHEYDPHRVSSRFSDGYAILSDRRGGRRYAAYVIIDTSGREVGHINPSAPLYADIESLVYDGKLLVEYIDTEGTGQGGRVLVDLNGNEIGNTRALIRTSAYYGDDIFLTDAWESDGILADLNGNVIVPVEPRDYISNFDQIWAEYASDPLVAYFGYAPFCGGLTLYNVCSMTSAGTIAVKWHYVFEVHEGTYTGGGIVYDHSKGGIVSASTPSEPVTPSEPAGSTPSSWAAENVSTAVQAGIVPEALQSAYTTPTTRAEFCALAVELYETVMGAEVSGRSTFSDTTDVNVEKAAFLGVVNGVGGGMFDPDAALTREQAATMLARLASALEKPLTAGTASFVDSAKVSSWAAEAVGQVQASGIMNGIEGNQFAPSDPYTREQSIVTMLRMYNYVK